MITQAELTKNPKWLISGHNKSGFLKRHSPLLVDELMQLTTKAYQNLNSDFFLDIEIYLKYYLENASPSFIAKTRIQIEFYAIGISYDNFDISKFVIEIIAEIQKHKILSQHFQYFYCSPKSYSNLYKSEINLVFMHKRKLTKSQAHLQLTKLIESILKKRIILSYLPSNYLTNESLNNGFFNHFIAIGTESGNLCQKQILKSKVMDEEKLFFISVILINYLNKSLYLSIEDVVKSNFYLSLRYMFSSKEQNEAHFIDNINLMRQKKYQVFSQYHQNNQELITPLVKKGLSYTQ